MGNGKQLYRIAHVCQLLVTVFLVLNTFGCTAKREQVRRESEAAHKLGVAFLSEGRSAPALRELAKADALTPDDPQIQNTLGLAYWMGREYGMAEAKLKRAVELKPDYSEAWNNLGALYLDQEKYDSAIPAFESALENVYYGARETALANLGRALDRTGRRDEAERRLREAVEIAPGFPLAHKFLGELLQEKGDHAGALAEFDRALEGLPQGSLDHLSEVQFDRGVSLLRLGDREAAREAFEQAWRLAPGKEVGKSAKNYLDLLE